jgi:7,8-dihydropterin-6-yl-methyl-4-(beta-D-ribofuranosyl)aminobenzene 5'-phosphate synthase
MNARIKQAYRTALDESRSARARGDLDGAFAALERAHILGQRHLLPHIVTHLHMLRIGWLRRDAREIVGQVVRLIATLPGYLTGWVPKGNPGGANISALKPVPLRGDLAELLADFLVWRDVGRRVVLLIGALLTAFLLLLWADNRRATEAKQLDAAWERRPRHHVSDFGSTAFVEITPIVNWRAVDGLRTEPGVSYLIRTDRYTVLFDLGYNRYEENPSPLEYNLAALKIDRDEIDGFFLSHAHRDHLGGTRWEKEKSFSFGLVQEPLRSDVQVLAPIPMTYPGLEIAVADAPRAWLPGLASTGPIPRRLMLGRIDEQALVIHVKGRGLVAIVGCGHQTVPKLLAHIQETFDEPLIGLVGDVHYPAPEGRLFIAGVDAQRWLASGDGPFAPIGPAQVGDELDLLSSRLEFIALGSHDTSDEAQLLARAHFGDRFEPVVSGATLCVEDASPSGPYLLQGRCIL